ncbi:MAG: hypothetical protein ABL888_11230 [Pirellulaceae bacterium]
MNNNHGGQRDGAGRPAHKPFVPKGEQVPPAKPDDLGEFASRVWDDAVQALPHILRPLDYGILRLACESFQLAMTAKDEKIRLQASRAFESLGRQIGLTPSSRRTVKPFEEIEPIDDDAAFNEWMKRGGLRGKS